MKAVKETLSELRGLELSSYPYFEVQELIRSLGKSKFLGFTLHPGKYLMRVRYGANYTKKSELTYLPQYKNTKCQRASTPNSTMFYGTIVSNEQDLDEARMIAACECSPLLRKKQKTCGIEKITYGRWRVTKDINLVVILDESMYAGVFNNSLLTELKEAFDGYIKSAPDIEDSCRQISKFFSEEFSKDNIKHDYDYFLSAIFTEVITNDLGFDGVMYPSVRAGGQLGFNVAIKPKTVDDSLALDMAAESTLYTKDGKFFNWVDKISKLNAEDYSEITTWEYENYPQLTDDERLEQLQIKNFDELEK
ncbi:hypothetical protein AGMMS49965_07200 [Bacteroidia bacterium]|nr:hypothetical protein AGMMS49965_07200 [Bacteroidia bacterium]